MRIKLLKNQTGQAFPVGIALFFVLGVASYSLYNTGQTVSEKTRIVNTADSAAYSGLLWQARAMNFTAYTNRAMVANQVAMAQAVSLHSWSGYAAKTGYNLDAVLKNIPYVNVVSGIVAQVTSLLDAFLAPISQAMLTVISGINSGITIAQEAMYASTFLATPEVVNAVVESNDENFKWETGFSLFNTATNLLEWKDLTEQFDDTNVNGMLERSYMVEDSLDKFSTERDWKFFGFFIPITPINWVRIEKHGGTELFENNQGQDWEINANDALSLRTKTYTWRGKKYHDIPISGASSIANTNQSSESILGRPFEHHGGRHSISGDRNSDATGGFGLFHDKRTMSGYKGMHAYRSLTTAWRNNDEPPMLKLRIEITMDPEIIHSGSEVYGGAGPGRNDVGRGRMDSNIYTPGDVLTSVSAAELFFERPCLNDSCDGTEEYADGYSPYWDVRLAKSSNAARLAAYALHDNTIFREDKALYGKTSQKNALAQLPGYDDSRATPIDDFKLQIKGVQNTISNMDAVLASLEAGSPEFAAYKQRLDGIKAAINLDVPDIVNTFVADQIDEGALVQELIDAAGIDFDVAEYEIIKTAVEGTYKDMTEIAEAVATINLEAEVRDLVDGAREQVEERIREELEDRLENAVNTILAGMLAGAVQEYTGITIADADIDSATDFIVDEIQDIDISSTHEDDIILDLDNECSVYGLVNDAELHVQDLQQKLELVNETIAIEFHAELIAETGRTVEAQGVYTQQIAELRALKGSNERHPDYPEFDSFQFQGQDHHEDRRHAIDRRITELETDRFDLYADRVDNLTSALQEISDRNTATILDFQDYNLDERFARRAVLDTIGDIQDLALADEDSNVSDNLFFADAENGVASDEEQSLTQAPEGC